MIPRPSLRVTPLAALAVVGGAYLIRSFVIRSGDFSIDLPGDAVAASVLAVALVVVTMARARATEDREERLEAQYGDEHDAPRRDG